MTVSLSAAEVIKQIATDFREAVFETSDQAVMVKGESLFEVAQYLKNSQGLILIILPVLLLLTIMTTLKWFIT